MAREPRPNDTAPPDHNTHPGTRRRAPLAKIVRRSDSEPADFASSPSATDARFVLKPAIPSLQSWVHPRTGRDG
jgi:hypothetical protein